MLQFEELRLELIDYTEKLKQLGEALGIERMNEEVASLEEKTAEEGFWNDVENSQKVQMRITQLKNKVKAYDGLKGEYDDALVLIELANEAEDLDMFDECRIENTYHNPLRNIIVLKTHFVYYIIFSGKFHDFSQIRNNLFHIIPF